ncbi:triosephosphate isomerase [Spirochaetia bacterium]|nr:triosephosphate isomerase [Spirochaetia bacterium]
MAEKLYIGTNTKMYKTIAETVRFLEKLGQNTADIPRQELVLFVIPSFTALERAKGVIKGESILLGAQNMCWEDQGQFTGEVSPLMLKEVGVQIVEIGHSERRHVFGEDDETENKKVLTALRHGFTALLCIGETAQQKEYGIADEVLRTQLKIGLHGVTENLLPRCMIAYEPVWAIGASGTPASREYAEEKHTVIRDTLKELYGGAAAMVPLLYGGSVNNANAVELIEMNNIDGLFIGRSAWDADNFTAIIRDVLPAFRQKH